MPTPRSLEIDNEKVYITVVDAIREEVYCQKRKGVVVGLSGGIDSTLTAKLAVDALGKEAVKGLLLFERDSLRTHENDAIFVAHWLGIDYQKKDTTSVLRAIGVYKLFPPVFWVPSHYQEKYARKKLEKMKIRFGRSPLLEILIGDGDEELRKSIAYVRVKNRIRMAVLYFFAELNNLLVLGTINKTEWLTGLFVPYGDGAADFMPLKHLYKTQIIKLAKFSNLPERIINKPPSPDLAPGITDEDILGIPYEKLDLILCLLEENTPVAEIASRVGMEEREIVLVQEWVKYSEKLRKMI